MSIRRTNACFKVQNLQKKKKKNQGVWTKLEMKICFLRQSLKKIVGKFTKLSETGFCMECFTAGLFKIFHRKTSKFGFWVTGLVLVIESKPSYIFLK